MEMHRKHSRLCHKENKIYFILMFNAVGPSLLLCTITLPLHSPVIQLGMELSPVAIYIIASETYTSPFLNELTKTEIHFYFFFYILNHTQNM